MTLLWTCILCAVVAYLLGSINSAIIITRLLTGKDVRTVGSGNAGATNALRAAGKKGALFVVLGDVAKTVVAILVARLVLHLTATESALPLYAAGAGAILGHNFPIYYHFRGGKGIITSATVLVAIHPITGLAVIVTGVVIIAISRYVSLGSVLASASTPVYAFLFEGWSDWFIFCFIIALLAIFMHRGNIVRLCKGTERKLGGKSE